METWSGGKHAGRVWESVNKGGEARSQKEGGLYLGRDGGGWAGTEGWSWACGSGGSAGDAAGPAVKIESAQRSEPDGEQQDQKARHKGSEHTKESKRGGAGERPACGAQERDKRSPTLRLGRDVQGWARRARVCAAWCAELCERTDKNCKSCVVRGMFGFGWACGRLMALRSAAAGARDAESRGAEARAGRDLRILYLCDGQRKNWSFFSL